MAEKATHPNLVADLRMQAEEIVRGTVAQPSENLEAMSPEAMRQKLHELRVHQIELTIQNDELHRAQMELDASRARYFDLYDLAPVGYVTVSEKGLILLANLKAATMLGVARGVLVNKPFFRFILNEDQGFYLLRGEQLLAAGEPQACDLRMVKKNGPAFWVHLEGAIECIDGATVCKFVMIDITQRKQAEAALRESDQLFKKLFVEAPLGVALIDSLTGHIYEVNPMFAKIAGRTMEEMVQINWMGITHPDDVQEDLDNMALLNAGKTDGFQMEKRYLHHDGTAVWINMTIAKIEVENTDPPRHLSIIEDITQRKRVEDKLRVSEERFAQMAAQAHEMIWEVDAEGLYTYVSQSCELITGYKPEEMVAKLHFYDLHPEEGRVSFKLAALSIFERNESFSKLQNEILAKDGRKVWLSTSGMPVLDIQGNLIGYRGSDYDITERLLMEEGKTQLEAQNRQLQKSESLGRMAAAIAHTFNNQLGTVIGNLEMAIDDLPKGSGPGHSLLPAAMRAAQKAAEVSGQMQTCLGQSFHQYVLLDLAEACRRNLPILEAAMPGTVTLETNWPSPGPAVMANVIDIQQVLINLITNAWEAVGKGRAAIHLNVKTVSLVDIPQSRRFPVGWQPQDSVYACLEVADTGDGIAEEDIESIFDPFFSRKSIGRGMGLPVVLGIVQAHGGAITVESEWGRGSTFRVLLPVSAEEVPRQKDKIARSLPTEGGGTVLLVDDDEMLRDMAAAMLKRLGFTVLAAKDGVEAVELFRQHQDEICLVLSDLTMPRMDGWETITALRKLSPGIPVILASGYDKSQVMAGNHPELPQVFFSKPYGLQVLKEAIGQALVSGTK